MCLPVGKPFRKARNSERITLSKLMSACTLMQAVLFLWREFYGVSIKAVSPTPVCWYQIRTAAPFAEVAASRCHPALAYGTGSTDSFYPARRPARNDNLYPVL